MRAIGEFADGAGGTARPSVVALQELTPSLLERLSPHLLRAGYSQPCHQPWAQCTSNGNENYGVALATRPPLSPLAHSRYQPYAQSHMGRGLMLGVATWGPHAIVLGSTHLESFAGEQNDGVVKATRRAQLHEAGRVLADEARRRGAIGAILLGDCNWTDSKDGDALGVIGSGWSDAWVEAGKPKGTAATCYSWRFDRCFVHARDGDGGARLRVASMALVGKQKLPDLTQPAKGGGTKPVFPSDHKGVLVGVEVR